MYKSPKRRNVISFLRLFVLSRWSRQQTSKRQNVKTKFHFFVYSFCRVVQVAKTKKWNFISSFVCFVAFLKTLRNDKTTKYPEISKFDLSFSLVRFVVCSFCRLPQGAKTTERQHDKMRFCGHFILAFVRLSPSIRRQNEQTKCLYSASIVL